MVLSGVSRTFHIQFLYQSCKLRVCARHDNIFLVLDAMTGQDAVQTARTFDGRLDLSGVIMTKLDGDARGGAALPVKAITGKPIKFLGVGERLDKPEEFRPAGPAGPTLGFGDVVGLGKDCGAVVGWDEGGEVGVGPPIPTRVTVEFPMPAIFPVFRRVCRATASVSRS